MTEQHPLTDEICHAIEKDLNLEWAMDCDEYMYMRAGADWQMKQVIEWLNTTPYFFCPSVMAQLLQEAMRPTTTQEDN